MTRCRILAGLDRTNAESRGAASQSSLLPTSSGPGTLIRASLSAYSPCSRRRRRMMHAFSSTRTTPAKVWVSGFSFPPRSAVVFASGAPAPKFGVFRCRRARFRPASHPPGAAAGRHGAGSCVGADLRAAVAFLPGPPWLSSPGTWRSIEIEDAGEYRERVGARRRPWCVLPVLLDRGAVSGRMYCRYDVPDPNTT